MGKYFRKDDILKAPDVQYEDVEAWGGLVRVKSMSGAEKDAFEASLTTIRRGAGGKLTQQPNLVNVRAKLLVACLVDEDGERIVSDEDVVELGLKSASEMDKVVEVAKRLNAMTSDDLKDLADGLKNAQPVASPTD